MEIDQRLDFENTQNHDDSNAGFEPDVEDAQCFCKEDE